MRIPVRILDVEHFPNSPVHQAPIHLPVFLGGYRLDLGCIAIRASYCAMTIVIHSYYPRSIDDESDGNRISDARNRAFFKVQLQKPVFSVALYASAFAPVSRATG
jgi:hypothetical protein